MTATLLKATVCATALGLAATSASAIDLNLVSGLAVDHIVEKSGDGVFIECVTTKSAGDIKINYFPSGQIVGVKEGVESLEQGLADIAFISPVNQGARMPLTGLSILPGLGESVVQFTEAFRKVVDGENPIAKEIRDLKMKALFINVLPPYQVLRDGPPITAMSDFDGMLTRAAGSSMILTMDTVGMTPVEMTAGDMYVAMQRGTIDATLLSTVSVHAYKLQELVKSMSRNVNFGTSVTFTAISDASWAKLSPEQQAVISECAAQVEADQAKLFDQKNVELFTQLQGEGVEIYDFSPELLAEINAKLDEVASVYIKRLEDGGVQTAQEGYDAMLAALGR